MKVVVTIEFNDAAEAYKFVGLLPGSGSSVPLPPPPVPEPSTDPFVAPKPEPTPLIMSHLDKITALQMRDVCTAKAKEFKEAGADGLTVIKKLISEFGELGKGVDAIHDSKRAAFISAVDALVP